jgi:hypothetical protein
MTSFYTHQTDRPDRFFGPGLGIVEKRPENSNQDMDKKKLLVDDVFRCAYVGQGKSDASQQAALLFRYPISTRLSTDG